MDFKKAQELAEKEAAAFVGEPKVKCPLSKSCLMVLVYKEDTKQILSGAKVQVSGTVAGKQGATTPIFQGKNTDGKGVAKFAPWDPGDYQVDVTLPSADGYEKPEITHQSVSKGKCPVCCIAVKPLPKLKVKVVQKGNHARVFNDALVKVIKAPQTHPDGNTKVGVRDYGRTKSGDYVVQVTSLSEEDRKEFVIPKEQAQETLSAGDDKTIIIEVEKFNVVTPMIEMEYKVVLLDRQLANHQRADEEKIYTDPTYIQLSFRQTNYSFPFQQGGKVKFSPANVGVYLDEQCKQKAPGAPASGISLTSAQITGLNGMQLYLRGKTAGKFKVTFELQDPQNEFIRLDKNPAEEEMGVVELKLKVHQYEAADLEALKCDPDEEHIGKYHDNLKKLKLPDQKPLSDYDKVRVGRFLHVQSEQNADRARLILEKLDSSQWPAGTDDYDIVLNTTNTSGSSEIFEKQFDEDQSSKKPLPVAIKVFDLKVAERELWAEGTSVCTALRGVRLDLGLDRAEGGLSKTPKRNGDWARFTIVQIKEVKVDYTPEAGKAVAWDADQKRFYINFKGDPNGRKITIGAQLTEKIAGVTLHFMLAPDKDNLKKANWGVDLPNTWKWKDVTADVKHKDKADRKNVIHLSAKTNGDGYSKKELVLSRFGGDKFHPAAYLDQDPHLAKYVDGHRVLEKRKPVFLKDHPLQVWRKFWYQEIKVRRLFVAGFGNAADAYKDVYAVMEAMEVKEMDRATANTLKPKVIYPKHMISYYVDDSTNSYVNNYPNDRTDGLVVGDDNESKFFALKVKEADKPVMIPMLNSHALWVADGATGDITMTTWEESDTISLQADKELLNPPLTGSNLLIFGNWEAQDWDPTKNGGRGWWVDLRSGVLSASNISLKEDRSDPHDFQVSRPAGIVLAAKTRWRVTGLTLNGAESFLGTSYKDGIVNAYTPNDQVDFINTIDHEIGHSFKQVTKRRPAGIPEHPLQYNKDGSHCKYKDKSCLMYESGPQQVHLDRYCPVCHPYVLVEDMFKE